MAINASDIKKLRDLTNAGMMDCKKALEASNGDIDQAILWLKENGIVKAAKKSDRIAAEGVTFSKQNSDRVIILEVNAETDFVAQNQKFNETVESITDAILVSTVKTLDEALKLKTKSGDTIEQLLQDATATIGEKIHLRRFELIDKNKKSVSIYNHSNKRVSVVLTFEGDIAHDDSYQLAMHVAAMAPKYKSKNEVPVEIIEAEKHIIKETTDLTGKPEKAIASILEGKLNKRIAEISLLEQPYVIDETVSVGKFLDSKKSRVVDMVRYEVGEGIEKVTTDFASEVAAQLKGN